jgi:protein-tyrosine phosphatase
MQVDSAMLFGNAPVCRLARAMLQHGLVDCIASDNHGDARSLVTARRWLEEIGATEQALLLTETNPGRVLANQGMLPVDPIPEVEEGVLARLRALITGRP